MFVFQLDPFLSSEIWVFDGIIAVGLAVFKAKKQILCLSFSFSAASRGFEGGTTVKNTQISSSPRKHQGKLIIWMVFAYSAQV